MTTNLSYRIATALMTAFVVISLWAQTVSIPVPAAAGVEFSHSLLA